MQQTITLRVKNILSAGMLAVALLSTPSCAGPQYRQLTILHTNDTHGHLIPFSYPDPLISDMPGTEWPVFYKDIGGIARRATLAHRIEQQMKRNVLLVDAGDELDGTPFSVEYMGQADFAAMAAAGYDLKVFGNHEFSANLVDFKRNIEIASFPTLCANMIDRSTGKPYEPGYKIMDFDGVKVAFFGLTVPNEYPAAREGYDFADPIKTARTLVPELRKSADIIVAITHLGEDVDEQLARAVSGIDVIVGGHSHTRLAKPVFISTSNQPQPFSIGGTVIVQDGQWGQELGRLDLCFRSDGNGPYTLMSYKGELLPITSDIPEDLATACALNKYLKPIWQKYGEVLGEAKGSFYNTGVAESTMLNLICDAMREETKTDVAFYNVGGVRSDLASGLVRMWDIATVMPFANTNALAKIHGKRLKKILVDLKPGVSGVRYKVSADNKLTEATINGKPIDDAAVYNVVTNSFLASGFLKDIAWTDTNINPRDTVANYIRSKRTISPICDGRRVNNGSAPPA